MGRKKTPTALKQLQGTYRNDRDGGTPQVPAESPPPPSWLDERAKRYWGKIVPWLAEYGITTRLDQVALALLVLSLADMVMAREIVEAAAEKKGTKFIAETEKGNIIQHPAVGVANKAHARVLQLLKEFGMTPAARASLKVGASKDSADPLEEFGVVA